MDRGAWQATVHGVAKSWTQLKRLSMHAQKEHITNTFKPKVLFWKVTPVCIRVLPFAVVGLEQKPLLYCKLPVQ